VARNHITASRRTPSNPRDLARALADPASAAELFGGSPEAWTDFEQEYAAASPMLNTLAEERAQVLLQEQLRAGGGKLPRGMEGTAGKGSNRLYDKRAPGAVLDGVMPESEWPLAQFVAAAWPKNEQFQPTRTALHNAMGSASAAKADFWYLKTSGATFSS
jgi:hypothetical protein